MYNMTVMISPRLGIVAPKLLVQNKFACREASRTCAPQKVAKVLREPLSRHFGPRDVPGLFTLKIFVP